MEVEPLQNHATEPNWRYLAKSKYWSRFQLEFNPGDVLLRSLVRPRIDICVDTRALSEGGTRQEVIDGINHSLKRITSALMTYSGSIVKRANFVIYASPPFRMWDGMSKIFKNLALDRAGCERLRIDLREGGATYVFQDLLPTLPHELNSRFVLQIEAIKWYYPYNLTWVLKQLYEMQAWMDRLELYISCETEDEGVAALLRQFTPKLKGVKRYGILLVPRIRDAPSP